jgi:uncharacterized protein YbaR (Trm112 family)
LPGLALADKANRMIDDSLLEILACPKTRKPLRLAGADVVKKLNDQIAAGKVKNRDGKQVSEAIQAGLIPEGEQVLYPVRDEIPILLIEEAIPFESP